MRMGGGGNYLDHLGERNDSRMRKGGGGGYYLDH